MQKTIYALLGISSSLIAAQNQDQCAPQPPATCYPDDCTRCYCLGPENYGANAPVCPYTCNGDISIWVAGLYWTAHQDGMEFAIDNSVSNNVDLASPDAFQATNGQFNNLIDARYLTPDNKWDWGVKVGIAYCSPCDGWDIGVEWTWFRENAHTCDKAEPEDNHVLLPLWSAFSWPAGGINFATQIDSSWKVELNLFDIELGRNFWTSRYLAVRPHIGLRIAFINQDFDIEHRGGNWGEILDIVTASGGWGTQDPLNNKVELDNDFKGVGIRGGLDSTWHLGCGFAIYGDLAASIVYGRFDIDHDEYNRLATSNSSKFKVLETDDHFRASRGMLDLGLGLQWMGMFCNCQYGLLVSLGWEQHLFFNQNQLWRVVRIGDTGNEATAPNVPNNTGENVFHQRRGDLDVQGVTLKLKFDF